MVVSHWLMLSGVPKLSCTPESMEFIEVCVSAPSAAVRVTMANIAYVRRLSMYLLCDCAAFAAIAPRVYKLVITIHANNFTMIGTMSTFYFAGDELEVERGLEVEGSAGEGPLIRCGGGAGIGGEQGDTIGSHEMPVRIDDHGHVQKLLEGTDDADVLAHAALKDGGPSIFLPLPTLLR